MENISEILQNIKDRNTLLYGPIMECCSFHVEFCRCVDKDRDEDSPKTSGDENQQ